MRRPVKSRQAVPDQWVNGGLGVSYQDIHNLRWRKVLRFSTQTYFLEK
jgi:hypothetical protein